MTAGERLAAAVAWCQVHQAAVWFAPDGVRVRAHGRTATRGSLVDAVGVLWEAMPR